jgi:hypothetical protein
MPFMFQVGETYETQGGDQVTVVSRVGSCGYEGLECSDGRYRYDQSNSSVDAGRVYGSNRDYSCQHNFKRADRPLGAEAIKTLVDGLFDRLNDPDDPCAATAAAAVSGYLREHVLAAIDMVDRYCEGKAPGSKEVE